MEIISIHAPRSGGDLESFVLIVLFDIFQSTPPARGATLIHHTFSEVELYFNPRPPPGGRL